MSEREIFCPVCGAVMERKLEDLTIGADGGGGLLSSLLYEQYEVDLYACPRCGKVELYTANFQAAEEPEGEAERSGSAAEPEEDAQAPEPPEGPEPRGGGLFGFGKRGREERPPWEK